MHIFLIILTPLPQQHFKCRIFACNVAFMHCGKGPEYFSLLATEIRCLSKCSLLTLICVCFDRSMSSFWWWRCTRWWNIPPPWNPTHLGWGVSGEPCHSSEISRSTCGCFVWGCVCLCVKKTKNKCTVAAFASFMKFQKLLLTYTFTWFPLLLNSARPIVFPFRFYFVCR